MQAPLDQAALLIGATLVVVLIMLIRALQREDAERIRRQNAEWDVQALEASLTHRIQQHTQGMRQHLAGLASFSNSLCQEMHSTLGAVGQELRRALELLDAGHSAAAMERLSSLPAQLDLMQAQVLDMLRLSRIQPAELQRVHQAMGPLVRDVLADLRGPQAEELSNGDVTVDIGELKSTSSDAALLRQLLGILLGNALHMAARGGRPAKVVVGSGMRDQQAAWFVFDSGPPVPAADIVAMFDGDEEALSAPVKGRMRGLWIVRRVVELHGGRAWAESPRGGGAMFWFTLGTYYAGPPKPKGEPGPDPHVLAAEF
jgi:signal transduction histidine kinase